MRGNVLITGGTGTMGHALVELSKRNGWDCHFVVYSRSEFLQAKMKERYPEIRFILGDIRNYTRLKEAMSGIDIVVHGAAMKRVPECEQQPIECYEINVQGSINVARACIETGVKQCIGISSNKACQATGVYGSSKLMMERLFASYSDAPCKFVTIRCGNVVASRGSIVTKWRNMSRRGEPLTVIDGSMTRFFLSPFDMAEMIDIAIDIPSGNILIKREKSLSIGDLAKILSNGKDPVQTGRRSGDRHHEELYHAGESISEYGQYWLSGDSGKLGTNYTSFDAPRWTSDEFMSMLEDAESLEVE